MAPFWLVMLNVAVRVLAPLALLSMITYIIVWLRQRRIIARAGVSPDSPGCARCLYIARGWNSPTCPECNADVREVGLVVRPRIPLGLKLLTVGLVTLAITMPLIVALGREVFKRRAEIGMWQFVLPTSSAQGLAVHIRTRLDSGFLVTENHYHTDLILDSSNTLGGLSISVNYFDGQWQAPQPEAGASDAAWKRARYGPDDTTPSPQDISVLISEATHASINDSALQGNAQIIARQIALSRSGRPAAATYTSGAASAGSGVHHHLWPPAMIIVWVAPVLFAGVVVATVWRRHKSGWRAAENNEWLQAPRLAVPQRESPRPSGIW